MFVPYGGNSQIENFVTMSIEGSTVLIGHHRDLANVIKAMEAYLDNHIETVTQEFFDLYILAGTWLLTYDKVWRGVLVWRRSKN